MIDILVVDDDKVLNDLFRRVLKTESNVRSVYSYADAENDIKDNIYDIVISDIMLPDGTGIDLLKSIKTHHPETHVIMITGHGNIDDAVKAIKLGAIDYLTKPVDSELLLSKIIFLKEHINLKRFAAESHDNIIYNSQAFQSVLSLADKVALTDSPVLISGETGTGKSVIAKYIHSKSRRSGKPFLSINCSNFQENIFESELFGYKKGAFTGAINDKAGIVTLAKDGTIFFDEVAEIPISFQAKLLNFLDDKTYMPIGSLETMKSETRIIAATNKNLKKNIEEKTFREDLYYRLNIIELHIPPLRERADDISSLIYYFIKKHNDINPRINGVTEEAIEILSNYNYPGNIRELANIIERAMIIETECMITPSSINILFEDITDSNLSLDIVEKKHILKVLKLTNYDKTRASELLNINRSTLYRKLADYKIDI